MSEWRKLFEAKGSQLGKLFSYFGRWTLTMWDREVWLRRRADRLKPPADVDLSVGFSTEVTSTGRASGIRVPLVNSEFSITALDHKPVIWSIADTPTNFATEFLKGCHALPLAS